MQPPPRVAALLSEPSMDAELRLRVTVARSCEEVETLRPTWQPLSGRSLPADLDYFLTLSELHPEIVRPHVVVVEPPDGTPCLLAGHVYDLRLVHSFAHWEPFRPTVRAINIHRGHLGSAAPDVLAVALRSLAGELGAGIDAILLRYLQIGSPLQRAALSVFPARQRERWSPVTARWSCSVGATLRETLEPRSRTTRENVRRIRRRIARDFGDRATVRVFRSPAEADALYRDIDTVAVTTYQTGRRTIFAGNRLDRGLTMLGMDKGWFRGYVLYVDRRPIAFWTGYAYGGVFGWRGVTGYDPRYRAYSPGTFLLTKVFEDLAAEPAVHAFSLGSGDFPYKRFFGDRRSEEIDVRVLASTPRGMLVNAVGSGVQAADLALHRVGQLPVVAGRADGLRRRYKRRHAGIAVK